MSLMSVTVETRELLAALDRLGERVERHIEAAAKVTAENIAREARARAARAWMSRSGRTVQGIGIEVARRGPGYVVYAENPEMPNLPVWLETGTARMRARPFFYASAALEEGAYVRRIQAAVQAAIDEGGLGS